MRPCGRGISRVSGFLPALLAFPVLFGCNKMHLAYEYADWMVLYAVRDNFDLDKKQRTRINSDVDDYFHWNRREMLPLYAGFLARMADTLRLGPRPDRYDSAFLIYRDLFRQTLRPVVEKAQTLLLSLSPEQIDGYAQTLAKKNGKLRKEYARPRDRILEKRFLKSVGVIEDWVGRLGPKQKEQLKPLSYALPWNGDMWLENRESLQAELIRILRTKPRPEQIRPFLEDYFLDQEKFRSPVYMEKTREYQARLKDFVLGLHAILTPQQVDHVVGQMKVLSRDLVGIHNRS